MVMIDIVLYVRNVGRQRVNPGIQQTASAR
jgi:hypothetical protein